MHPVRKIVVATSIALWLVATETLFADEKVIVATPTFSQSGGDCGSPVLVVITDVTPKASIYYTINGETPTTSSSKYTAPIAISKTGTIKAIAGVEGSGTSAVASATIFHDREWVLHKLDEAAKNFHSTSTDFEFDSVTTDPIPDKDVQTCTVYYDRTGKNVRMAAHITKDNNNQIDKVYTFSGGVFKLFEGGNMNQVTTFAKASKYESYLMLGFGASGKDLEEKWGIKYLGCEALDGVKTEKLDLVAKDPDVRKNIAKVTVWMDVERGISLKQIFDEGSGQYRVSVYFNRKVNQSLPADAFTFNTNAKTQQVNR